MPSEPPFEPRLVNESKQDTNYVPNEIQDTLKGGSALPGSAAGYPSGTAGKSNEGVGFVGTRYVPDPDEK